jgi:hypothetical protein
MCNAHVCHYFLIQNTFTVLKVLFATSILLFFTLALEICGPFIVSRFVLSKLSYSWNYITYSLFKLAFSLKKMCSNFFHIFHGFIPHFFLALSNIPLLRCDMVYFFIHPLKDILFASNFCQL